MSASLNNKLRNARKLLQNGDIADALALCGEILGKAPRNPEALTLRGIAALMQGSAAEAAQDFRLVLAAAPRDGAALEHLGLALLHLGQFAEAADVLSRASAIPGAPASTWMRLGLALLHQERIHDALPPLQQAVRLAPDNADCRLSLGRALAATGDATAAEAQFEAALQFAPGHIDALFNLGVLHLDAGALDAAGQRFETVLQHDPRHADAMVNLAVIMEQQNRSTEAVRQLEQVLSIIPGHPHAHGNLGRIRLTQLHLIEARRHFESALAALPTLSVALEGLITVACAQGRYGEAVHWCDRLIAQDAANAAAWAQRADSLLQTGKLEEAETSAQKALELDASLPQSYGVLAQRRIMLGQLDTAIEYLKQGAEKTGNAALLGQLVHQARHMCDWTRWQDAWLRLAPLIAGGEDCGSPFSLLCEDLSAAQQLEYTRQWARRRFGPPVERKPATARADNTRLRIAYLSSDFQDHPAAYLITEMLELHDRSRFEIFAYSYGPADEGAMRRRIIAAVDHFVDIAWEPDDLAVERIRKDGIDILIDLKGYTVGDRLAIMAQRPSPVQVTWLGYPGTTGADFMDYLVADPEIVRADENNTCSERVIRMPHCYQPTDRKRSVATALSRHEYGLPEQAFVFCCFNQTFKITPDIFAVWLHLLQTTPDSVLWLLDANRWATANLHRTAEAVGIAADRLVFAPRIPLAEHLARYRVADLALDTFPYTSHTTASDALWCGCPLVALRGDTFPARVSASILAACELPDLITDTVPQYQQKILELAMDRNALQQVKHRLAAAHHHAPLFDAAKFARNFETLLSEMHSARSEAQA